MVSKPDDSSDWLPRPDPTLLTSQQLFREIASLKEIVFTRLDAMDHALAVATDLLNRQPSDIDRAVQHLEDKLGARMNGMDTLRNEKFAGLQNQLSERDERFVIATQASKEAVEKALAAAKENLIEQNRSSDLATAKMENSFTKQIDQLYTLIQSQDKANDDKFGDIKDRLTRIEGVTIGKQDTEKVHRDNFGLWIAMVAAIAAVALFIASYHKV